MHSPFCEMRFFFVSPVQKSNPGIRVTILLEDEDRLVFSPNFAKVQTEILRMVDSINNATKLFPRIEAKVYVDVGAGNIFLKVTTARRNIARYIV